MSENGKDVQFVFRPIGVIHTPYRTKSGIPIQGVFDQATSGTVELFEEYEEGLTDIEGFSHLILLYAFDRSEGFELMTKPYMDETRHGVFAQRAPKRPNPIGLSIVRLLRRKGRILSISEIDMLDDTPLLDIKPYVPRFDVRLDARSGWMEGLIENSGVRKVSDDRF